MFQTKLWRKSKYEFYVQQRFPKVVPFMRQREKKMVHAGRPQMTIWRMRFTCWITKATDIHSEYVMLLLFHGNNCYTNVPTLYAYTYIACLIECYNNLTTRI